MSIEGVCGDRDDLVRTYGVSQRLAVRLGALLAKKLEVTATILEVAGPGSAVERLLLHPQILAHAEHLDSALVQKIAAETEAETDGSLAVIRSGARRLLALEEELLAEEGWQAQKEGQSLPSMLNRERVPALRNLLQGREIRRLFTPEEIARIKLDAVAGRDAESRISALRKLLYAPLNEHEKGGIYLRALLDPVGSVRAEAIKALESLGFDRDTADAIQAAFEGDTQMRKAALRRIGDLLGKLQPAERQVVLAVLLELFREMTPGDTHGVLLGVLDEAAPILTGHPQVVPEITRVCVRHLIADPLRVGPQVRNLLLKIAATVPEPVLEKLRAEIATVREPASRALLLGILMEVERDEARREELCETVVEELLNRDLDELDRQKLGHNMAALGLPAARAVMRRFASASTRGRAMLASFLDILAVDRGLPTEVRLQAARHLLEALKTADRPLRMEILRTRVFQIPGLDADIRKSLVHELIPLLRTAEYPDLAERAASLLELLGDVAAERLFNTIRERPSTPTADLAARTLGHIVAGLGDASALTSGTVSSILDFMSKQASRASNKIGGYPAALGEVAASPAANDEQAQAAFDILVKQIGNVHCSADVVEAIGRLGASGAIAAKQRIRAVHLLGSIVERPGEDEETQLQEITTDEGKIYEITGRLDFDSATLPAAVQWLAAITLSGHITPALQTQIIGQLLRVWEGVANWTTVWGPRSSQALARAIGRIGADAHVDDGLRERIIRALAAATERLSVVRALGEVFAAPCALPDANRAAVETALNLFEKWLQPEITPEELQAVLTTASRLAARHEISARNAHTRALRRRTVELLFDAFRNGHAWSLELLRTLRDSRAVPRQLRKEITDHLQKAPAITRAEKK